MKLDRLFGLLLVLWLPAAMWAQRTISGTVTDAQTGEPLIGANILVVGFDKGTVTDLDGRYELEVPEGATTLRFSYTGYQPQEVTIDGRSVIDVALQQGELLGEVVVIGYGKVKREDATGSVQSVSAKDFNRGAITGPQELLAGKVAGVQVVTDPSPGGGAVIRIRGGSSLSASNDPLIVVDGVPVDNGGIAGERNILNFLNPNDIESFTVLKDASATAIYGSRASNGVILITTKKGSLGKKLSVQYNGNFSISSPIATVDVLDAADYRALIESRYPEGHPARDLLGDANTDWQDVIYDPATGHDHNLSFSGGIGVVPYRVSLGYTDKNGILLTDRFTRTTAALNLSPGLLDNRLQINFNVKGMRTHNRFANRGAIGAALFFDPTQPVYDEGNAYGGYFTWLQNNGDPNPLAPANPLALLELRDDQSDVNRILVNGSADYRFGFLPDLRATLNLGYDYSKGQGTVNVPDYASFAYDAQNGGGEKTEYNQEKKNELLEFYLTYGKEFEKMRLEAMGGYSWQHFWYSDNFFSSNLAGTETNEGDNAGELYLVSLFGRLNLTFSERYLLTLTLRRDGTSRFSPDARWGMFPSAAFAVKVIENGSGAVSSLKLRLGYGVTGQQDVGGYYLYLPRYLASFDNARYQFGDEFVTTLRPEGYDYNIKWEETTTYNAAVDFGLLDGRLSGTLEGYIRQTDDLINFIPVPAGTNLTNFINTNVGNMVNRGVELTLNGTLLQTDDLNWDFGFNATWNQNEITKLTASDDPTYKGVLVGGISGAVGNTIQIHSVGYPANSFYVFEQVYDENGKPIEGLYVDRNGDGQVNSEDLYRYKKPQPDWFLGFNSFITKGNLELSFAGRANIGNYVYNNVQSNGASFNNLYHPTGYLGNVHRVATELGFENPQYFSDHFVQDGSFLRLDHITLGYNLTEVVKKMSTLKVYLTVQNPLLITNYEGIDPEVFGGIDNNVYPRQRVVLFGLNAGF